VDEAAIETTKLGKVYPGGVRALDEVSIRTAYGEIYAYLAATARARLPPSASSPP
jgi:ABC-type multidrug transport system ATPase subunit